MGETHPCLLALGIALAALLAAAGCAHSPPPLPAHLLRPLPTIAPALQPEPGPPPAASGPVTRTIGRTVQGRPIQAHVFEGDQGCVLILGGIHGDEPAGSDLVRRLAVHLEGNPADVGGRRIVLVYRASPDGLAARTRGNARGVDLNRNFSSAFAPSARNGRRPYSEPETRALVAAIARYRPSCVVSVHGPLNCVDPDGGAASGDLARAMAAVGPLPVKDLPALPGSLGTYCGRTLGLKMITYELDHKAAPRRGASDYLDRHIPALLVAIRRG